MTPPNWDHVDDQNTRLVLAGALTDPSNIEQAIIFADQCLQADQHNEDVTRETYKARSVALDAAEAFWQLPSIAGTVANLRVFWSI